MNSGSAPKGAPEAATAKRQAHWHLSLVQGQALQLGLFIPNHLLHPAEVDLRFVANTMPRTRSHWWIRDIRRHQAECTWCRRCDPGVAA